jgi:TonB-dependent SusC/RagA subfamily outer membrane receptor
MQSLANVPASTNRLTSNLPTIRDLMMIFRGCRTPVFFLALGITTQRFAPIAMAQEPESITGHVSAGGQPVQGATIRIRELGIGTTTNADGRFTFIVRSASVRGQKVTLEARHVRYNVETVSITLTGGTLTQDFELFPVGDSRSVAAGQPAAGQPADPNAQGPGPRAAVVVARPTLDSTAFEQLPGPTDFVSALAGRVVGLDVTTAAPLGGSSVAILRGYHSVLGNTQPLFVVDGVPMENTNFVPPGQPFGTGGFDYGSPIQSIEPSEIASVQVLRGPDAAIWGGRAANGVILITTKGGRGLTGFEVSASQNASTETTLRLPSFQNAYGQGLNGQFSFFDGAGGGTNDGVAQNWGPALQGQAITQASQTVPRFGDVRPWLPRPNNVSEFYTGGNTLTTAAAAQQAGPREDFRLSIDRRSSTGIVPTSSLIRQGAALRGEADLTPAFTLGGHGQVSNDVAKNRSATGYDPSNTIGDFARTGRQVDFDALRNRTTTGGFNPDQISWNYTGFNNPFFALQNNQNRDERTRWTGGASAAYAFNPSLSAVARVGTDHYDQSRDFDIAPTWMGGFPLAGGRGDFSHGGFQRQQITASETNAEVLLSGYVAQATGGRAGSPGPLHLTAGFSHRANSFSATTSATDQHPDTGTAPTPTPSTLSNNNSTNALLATAEWAVSDYASVAATARNEWYSLLASGSNSGFYPSILGRIDLARAAGIRSDNLNAAIVRAGWSRVGGEVSPLLLTNVFKPASDSGATISASPSLGPEITTSFEVGGSLSLLRNRVAVDLTLYDEQTTGVILGVSGSGNSILASNVGTLSNKGVELQATLVPVRTSGGTQWSIDARLAKNTNSVDELGGATSIPLGPPVYGLTVQARQGFALGALVGSGFKRDASGSLLLQNGLPVSDGQQRVLGVMAPDWSSSVSSSIHVGWFDLSALVDARMGGSVFSTTNLIGMTTGTFQETASRPDSGQAFAGVDAATGHANTVRATTQAYYQAVAPIQEAWIYDASFVKLRDARISFSWPLRAFTPLSAQSIRVSLIGRNLAMWSKAPNIDPETALSTTSFQGVELGQLPSIRSLGLQFSLTP